jgi:hypothetical protein
MAILPILAGMAALAGFCLFCVRRAGLSAGLAPLASLSAISFLLLFTGMADVLRPGVYGILGLGWVLLIEENFSIIKDKEKAAGSNQNRKLPASADACAKGTLFGAGQRLLGCAPGALLFWAGAVFLALRLCWLQPEFTAFDEYSFWGTAAKLTAINGRLYALCESGVPWQMTQMAALPLASYFFQPFGQFAAWRAIFAADVLILAGLAAVITPAEKAGRRVTLPLGVAVVLLVSAFSASGHTSALCMAWLEFMGDMPAGVLFGAAAAFWLAVREKRSAARWWIVPVLCLAANIKSNTFVLALAAAGCIAVDEVFFAKRGTDLSTLRDVSADKKHGGWLNSAFARFLARVGFALACFAAPAAQYLSWSWYTAGLVKANAASGGLGDTANVTLPAVALNGFKILLGRIGENYFEWHRQDLYDYRAAMRTAFFQKSVSIFGAGIVVCLLIAAVFVLAVLFAPTLREKLRVVVLAACSTLCFAGYWLMILFSYAFLMRDATVDTIPSYARYFNSYYIGWALLALAMLGRQAAAGRRIRLAQGSALALAAGAAAATLLSFEPQYTILGASRGEYAAVRAEYAVAQQASDVLEPGAKLFLVYQGDQGQKWFLYSYALLPRILQYGAGGGTYGEPIYQGTTPYFQPYKRRDFQKLVAESGADYMLIVHSDDAFLNSYGPLFTDALALAGKDSPAIYKITDAGYEPLQTLARPGGEASQ